MSKDKDDMNGLGPADKVIDMGDLYGNPIPDKEKKEDKQVDLDDIELSDEEEELLKKKLEQIRKSDPFIYR
jgi:hypothetical protein